MKINLLPENFEYLPLYLYTFSTGFHQDYVNFPTGRDFCQILFVIDGKGVLECNNKTYELKKGYAFYTSKDIPISYGSTDNLLTAFVTVKGDTVITLEKYFNCDGFLFKKIDTEEYLKRVQEISDEFHSMKRNSILSSLCYSFLVDFFEYQVNEPNQTNKIKIFIEKNFTKKLTLEKIANEFSISVSKLSHDFKKEYNHTIFHLILNSRLDYAKNLIFLNSDLKIKDIALSCGFEDISYFCKAYKQKFGITPSEYKKNISDSQV